MCAVLVFFSFTHTEVATLLFLLPNTYRHKHLLLVVALHHIIFYIISVFFSTHLCFKELCTKVLTKLQVADETYQ